MREGQACSVVREALEISRMTGKDNDADRCVQPLEAGGLFRFWRRANYDAEQAGRRKTIRRYCGP